MAPAPDVPAQSAETRRMVIGLILLAAASFTACLVSNAFAFGPEHYPSIRIGSALVFVALSLSPVRTWPLFYLATLLPTMAHEELVSAGRQCAAALDSTIAFICGAASVALMHRTVGKDWTYSRSAHSVTFVVIAMAVPAVIGTLLMPFPRAGTADIGPQVSWTLWALAEGIGMLVLGPMLLTCLSPQKRGAAQPIGYALEGFVLITALLVVGDLVFGNWAQSILPLRFRNTYMLFPPLLWASMRFSTRGAAMACFILAILATWHLRDSAGPFLTAKNLTLDRLLLTHSLIFCIELFTLVPAAVIAERGKVSQLLQETSSLQNAIFNSANMSIMAFDVNGVLRSANATTEKWLGWRAADMCGRFTLLDLHEPEHITGFAELWSVRLGRTITPGHDLYRAIAEEQPPREHEMVLRRNDGSTLWTAQSVTLLRNEKHEVTGFLITSRDIRWRKHTEKALRDSESAVRSFFDAAPMMMGIVELHDDEPVFVSANQATAEFLSHSREDLASVPLAESGMPPQLSTAIIRCGKRSAAEGKPIRYELAFRRRERIARFVVTVSYILSRDHEAAKFCFIVEDVTAQRHTQDEVERFAAILEATTDLVAYTNKVGQPMYVNRAARDMFGLGPDADITTKSLSDLHPPHAYETIRHEGIPVAMIEGAWQGETAVRAANGREVPVSQVILSHRGSDGVEFLSMVMRDITERKATEETIRASLREKEALLKEIHHRVKNNLQVVSSLLGLQAGYIEDPAARSMFMECRERIKTMALIHEKLYQSGNLGSIDFGEFLKSVVPMIFSVHSVRGANVRVAVSADPVRLSLDLAIPLGLVVNELVSNSLKHAFTGKAEGLLQVSLKALPDGSVRLLQQDDGVGLPPGFAPEKSSSLGLKLVHILVQQIGANLVISGEKGASFDFTFRPTAIELEETNV